MALVRVLSFVLLASVLQCAVFAQEESAPQTRLSSKGLAYVNLSTSPADPVVGQPTIILLEFLDPQTKAPRGDIYYKVIIRNDTSAIFVLPGGSTIAGKVGIPYQFDRPGSYQVEVSLNDTDISKSTSDLLDTASFPVYVSKASPQHENVTSNSTTPVQQGANIVPPKSGPSHLLSDGILVAAAIGIVAIVVARRVSSRRQNPAA